MTVRLPIRTLALLYVIAGWLCTAEISAQKSLYPPTPVCAVFDTIWGTNLADPYRWMEARNTDTLNEWLHLQEKVTASNQGLAYSALLKYLAYYSNIEHNPLHKEGRYYFRWMSQSSGQSPSLFFQEKENGTPRLLFNPATLGDQEHFGIESVSISDDQTTLALVLAKYGADWHTIRFVDLHSRKLLPDTLLNVKYSQVCWSGSDFLYSRYPTMDPGESFFGNIRGKSLYLHKLGIPQRFDSLIYKPEYPTDDFYFEKTPEGKYVVLYHVLHSGAEVIQGVSLLPLPLTRNEPFRPLILTRNKDLYFNVLGASGTWLLVETNLNASSGAIYAYDPEKINQGESRFAPRRESLDFAQIMGNRLIRVYADTLQSFAILSDLNGAELTGWEIPKGFAFSFFSGSPGDSVAHYAFSSFFSPASVYRINLNSLERRPLSRTRIFFDNRDLQTELVHYMASDSVRIPMYLTYRKGLQRNGSNPVLLLAYGGFGIKVEPYFDLGHALFMKNGGILAVPCIRGGGGYVRWHEQGRGLNKPRTIADVIDAADFLIRLGYTNSGQLAAMGQSHGGMVVFSAMIQRPELFKAVVSQSGVMDMLRYHLFNVAYLNAGEYGTVDDSLGFRNLLSYSPVHNVSGGIKYPATLMIASEYDDRVNPFHTFKMLASLQAADPAGYPHVMYYMKNAGHSGSPIPDQQIRMQAYLFAFLFKHLGMERKIRYE